MPRVSDLAVLLKALHGRGLYLIARIVAFKDDPLAQAHPEWAVRDAQGNIWQDREQLRWIDPTIKAAWTHNLDLAEEAARLGFDEIQFDYLRFPDAGGLVFSEVNTRAHRVAAISGFLAAARERLRPYNVFLAADIFGYVCWNPDDTAIGQQIGDYAFDHRDFDDDEIREQVEAADAAGTNGWMLWNPRNRYDPATLPR